MAITFKVLTDKKKRLKDSIENHIQSTIKESLPKIANFATQITPVYLGRLIHNYDFVTGVTSTDYGYSKANKGSRAWHTTQTVGRAQRFHVGSAFVRINLVNSHDDGNAYKKLDAGILTKRSAGGQSFKIETYTEQLLTQELKKWTFR